MYQNKLETVVTKYVTPTNMLLVGGGVLAVSLLSSCDLTTLLLLGALGYLGVTYCDEIKEALKSKTPQPETQCQGAAKE